MTDKGLVVVTGASGFIAQHTIKKLLGQGYAVRGTVRDAGRIDGLKSALAGEGDITNLSFVEVDLTSDAGWPEAMVGARYLLHMASPLPAAEPEHEDDLIVPAREGALRALKAAAENGIERIVLTSSVASVSGGNRKSTPLNEEDWSDINQNIGAYPKSKTLAEKAAWEYINSLPADGRPEFAVINPGFVLGPLLTPDTSASHEVLRRLLTGEVPGIPNIGFNLVDVRDVADAHIAAMTNPAAPGNRYICVNDYLAWKAMAKIVHENATPHGYKITLRSVPDWLVRFMAMFKPELRIIVPRLGNSTVFDTSKIRTELGFQPLDLVQTIRETTDSLIEHKIA